MHQLVRRIRRTAWHTVRALVDLGSAKARENAATAADLISAERAEHDAGAVPAPLTSSAPSPAPAPRP